MRGNYRLPETIARRQLEQLGCKVTAFGWPDFFVEEPDRIRLVEVKGETYNGKESLTKVQKDMHALILKHLGIRVEVLYIKYDRQRLPHHGISI